MPRPADVQEVFFDAMNGGYTGGGKETAIQELPGSKLIRFEKGYYLVTDCWFTTEGSDNSWGFTQIYHKGQPIWVMTYGGFYPSLAIPFLKQALAETYKAREFQGCRGPRRYEGDGLSYTNEWHGHLIVGRDRPFARFEGKEYIHHDGVLVGTYTYDATQLVHLS